MTLVIGAKIHSTSYISATEKINLWSRASESRYICAANVHMVMEAHDSSEYKKTINNADIVTPDGMPLVWMLRLKGHKEQQRVYGPTLMLHVLKMAERENIPVGFYGGDVDTSTMLVERMQAQYPRLHIAYAFSPPFHELSSDEDAEIVGRIRKSGIKILFVALGCPKQECWMAEHRDKIPVVMLGVGAAFDFHAGKKAQSPAWMQRLGLEWLFRLVHEPRRLWKRYLYHNTRFVFLALADLLGFLEEKT